MHQEPLDEPRAAMEGERRFTIYELSWPDELYYFGRVARNYADAALALHRRHGDVVRKRLPRRALWFVHPRHMRRILRTNVRNYPKGHVYDFTRAASRAGASQGRAALGPGPKGGRGRSWDQVRDDLRRRT